MAEQCSARKKRPAMQLYVPPGRRSSDRPSASDKRSHRSREKRDSVSIPIESNDTTTSNEDLNANPICTQTTEPRLPSLPGDTNCANTKDIQEVNEEEVIGEEPKSDVNSPVDCLKENNAVEDATEDNTPIEKTEVLGSPEDKENEEQRRRNIDRVIVLDERREPPKIEALSSTKDKLKSEHEEEKEIMRKAKENINKKTRKPLMKYVVDDDTLKINDVNNWEDLFDDEGELQDEIFAQIVQKVGTEVAIAKVTEDYSAYAAKQLEELEHMVELYDFPATLETNDIMSAFRELQNDSMYIKWVDDTHAILVLGSSTQARRALEMSNSLIKVRPMSAASRTALEKANQFDLKPAMKRPPTNLQTARRLITSHLGAKSKITKEQNEREKTDLKKAKELKKKALQAERDAWEGTLQSNLD